MQKVEGSSPFIRLAKGPEIRVFFFSSSLVQGSRSASSTTFVYQTRHPGGEGPPQPVEVANEVGLDEAEVSADLVAGDDAAAE